MRGPEWSKNSREKENSSAGDRVIVDGMRNNPTTAVRVNQYERGRVGVRGLARDGFGDTSSSSRAKRRTSSLQKCRCRDKALKRVCDRGEKVKFAGSHGRNLPIHHIGNVDFH